MDGLINVPKTGKDLDARMGERSKPLPLSHYTRPYLVQAYENDDLRPLCLAFNGENNHGSVKNDSIVLATAVIQMAKECDRRRGGIGPKQLLSAAKGE